jgi:hypothetical protein
MLKAGAKQRGFQIAPQVYLYTARGLDGQWSAWAELVGQAESGSKLFQGASAYQAQLNALRYIKGKSPQSLFEQGGQATL